MNSNHKSVMRRIKNDLYNGFEEYDGGIEKAKSIIRKIMNPYISNGLVDQYKIFVELHEHCKYCGQLWCMISEDCGNWTVLDFTVNLYE